MSNARQTPKNYARIYQPWDPQRLRVAKKAQIPFDLVFQLEDHPVDPTSLPPQKRQHVQIKSGVYEILHDHQTEFDVNGALTAISTFAQAAYRYQTERKVSPDQMSPFVCHFYAAPDPLSPAWLPILTQLLTATQPLQNVQWEIFTDGRFWNKHIPAINELLKAVMEHRLNIMLYVDQLRLDGTHSTSYDYSIQSTRQHCRTDLYETIKAHPHPQSHLTNLCIAAGATYGNSATLQTILQEAGSAGAHPVIGRPPAFYFYKKFFARYPFLQQSRHYQCAELSPEHDAGIIAVFQEWCQRQQRTYPNYCPIFPGAELALCINEYNEIGEPHFALV